MLSRMISTALIAGVFAGLCLFLVQRSLTLPVIHKAETFEKAMSNESAPDPFASEPMRSLSTLLGDVFVGIGFGLILTGVFALTGREGWLAGLLFGAAGFAVFHAAPAMVVPPAVPGMEVAPLLLRQIGWLAAAVSAIVGIAAIYRARGPARLAGILVIALAPMVFRTVLPIAPAHTSSQALAAIDQIFIIRALASMLTFWLIIGIAAGYLFARSRKNATTLGFADGRT